MLLDFTKKIKSKLRVFVPPSIRFASKQWKARIRQFLASLCFWKWKRSIFYFDEARSIQIDYFGRPESCETLGVLLGLSPELDIATTAATNKVVVREYPMRNSVRVPSCLTTIVKLGRTEEEILATYSRSLRRSIVHDTPEYRYESVKDIHQMEVAEHQMLKPYASARHDVGAAQLDGDVIKKLAQPEYGRLDFLYKDQELVGCHLGNFYVAKGKKYWHVNRMGYPESVFSDGKRWGEINSINLHLALRSAIENGYDYCDYGVSLARPGAGLIEWKRRRRGFLVDQNFKYLYLQIPKECAATLFWNSPLFGVECGKVTLHLGVLEGKTDEEVMARYHEMGYGGLLKVYLHCSKPPSEALMEAVRGLYADQESQPMIITYLCD